MKAVIVGAGEVGYHLADRLSKEGHDVSLIEQNADRESTIRDKVNANILVGNGASAEILEAAGIRGANIFIAVTAEDEVNMVACLLAKEYGVERTIARVKRVEYTDSHGKLNAEKLGIELIINPQSVVADEICEMVYYSDAVEAAEFAYGKVVFLGYRIDQKSPLVGKTLKDLRLTKGNPRLIIVSIKRKDKTIIPHGKDKVQTGDILSVVFKKEDLEKVRERFGFKHQEAKNIFVLGAGNVGYQVTRRLADGFHRVKVVDRSQKQCQELAEGIEDALVLCTDSTDVETLKNEGIEKGDAFIAVTDDDQSNILGSLLAKRHGVKRAIALVNERELRNLADSLGIDAVVSPRLSTASAILKYIRRGKVLSMVEQMDAEVLELQLPPTSRIIDKTIDSLHLPHGMILGAIDRNGEIIIPGGSDELKSNDRVIVFTLLKSVTKVEKIFS